MDRPEFRGIAAKNPCRSAEPKRFDIRPHQRTGFGTVVDEQRESGAARHGFEPESAGAGKEIEDACSGHRIAVAMEAEC